MDQWVQKLSLLILLVVVCLCLYGSTQETSCWVPDHMTASQTRYAQQTCSQSTKRYLFIPSDLPKRPDFDYNATHFINPATAYSQWLLKVIMAEILAVCVGYSLISWLQSAGMNDAASFSKELHHSYMKIPLYFLIQVALGLCWLIFTIITLNNIRAMTSTPVSDDPFMCDYQVRRLGNVVRYTIQCITKTNNSLITNAFLINLGLGIAVTLTKVIHVVSALFIGPILSLKTARSNLVEGGIVKNPQDVGMGFVVSDLYFSMLVSGHGGSKGKRATGNAGSDRDDIELLTKHD